MNRHRALRSYEFIRFDCSSWPHNCCVGNQSGFLYLKKKESLQREGGLAVIGRRLQIECNDSIGGTYLLPVFDEFIDRNEFLSNRVVPFESYKRWQAATYRITIRWQLALRDDDDVATLPFGDEYSEATQPAKPPMPPGRIARAKSGQRAIQLTGL